MINHRFFKNMTKIPKNYKPTQKEKFMNAKMKEYFKQKLINWKSELLKESSQTLNNLQIENEAKPDITDRASEEIDRSFELRTRDRERKLLSKIKESIEQLQLNDYGYCLNPYCGIEIGIRRLEARPTATLCIDCKNLQEIEEKQKFG